MMIKAGHDRSPRGTAGAVPGAQHITLAHGGGGQLTDDLLSESILPRLGNPLLADLLDSGLLPDGGVLDPRKLALTIDSYVVQPLFFPGGDIGRLAVCGTVNDLAVTGATPRGIALSLILEEGLERSVLDRVIDSIAQAAREAGVDIITGDTKVVGHGRGDGLYITTAGLGVVERPTMLHPVHVQPGDLVIVSGSIAEHGLAVMLARELPEVVSTVRSDAAPLNGLIDLLLTKVPSNPANPDEGVVFLRDATRGGLACVASDLAARTGHNVVLYEGAIAVQPDVLHAADMLGLDPLDVANEGKVVVVVRPDDAPAALEAMQQHPLGRGAAIIGRVEAAAPGAMPRCELHTRIGGRRIVQKPYGEQLPRIC